MGELQQFGDGIWLMDGPRVWDTGFLFATRMTIVRLPDGAIWIESPVPVSFEALKSIRDLGPVRYLVTCTPRHVWRLDSWHTLFPEAELWTSPPTLFTLGSRKLPLTGVLGDQSFDAWGGAFEQLVFRGNPLLDEVVFLHRPSKTLILGDMIGENTIRDGMPLQNAIFKLQGWSAGHPGMGLDMRLTFFDRAAARKSLARLLSWDFDQLVIAHGDCVRHDARALIEGAFRWLH